VYAGGRTGGADTAVEVTMRLAAFLLLVAACGGKKEKAPPSAEQEPTAKPPPPAVHPPTGKCVAQLEGSGPVECPYPSVSKRVKGDYALPFERGGKCESPGRVRLTSGHVVATDPLVNIESPGFTVAFPPGSYPVTLALVDGDISHALVRISDERPVRWEQALQPGENPKPGQLLGYPVDSGTGSYMDEEAARMVERRQNDASAWCAKRASEKVDPSDADGWHRAMEECEKSLGPDLLEILYAAGYRDHHSANVCVDPGTGANLIAFTSGAGDGVYSTFVGFGADGKPVAMVTDFKIAYDDEDGDGEPDR
jgi:hypothetical protein